MVNTFGTGMIAGREVHRTGARELPAHAARHHRHLNLRRPIYRKTAAFGHFGRTEDTFTWEATDKAGALNNQAAAAQAVAQ